MNYKMKIVKGVVNVEEVAPVYWQNQPLGYRELQRIVAEKAHRKTAPSRTPKLKK